MGSRWLHDFPLVLAGVADVQYHRGWETRSRSSGGFDALLGIVCHHTATSRTFPFDRYCTQAWETHPQRPVANLALGRNGEIRVGVAGASNHAGTGGPYRTSKGTIPADAANRMCIGIEALNEGTGEPWPKVQQERYLELLRALNAGYGFQPVDALFHQTWTPPRKIDPAGPSAFGSINKSGTWDLDRFRAAIKVTTPPKPPFVPRPPQEDDDMMFDGFWRRDNDDSVFAVFTNGTKQWLCDDAHLLESWKALWAVRGASPQSLEVRTQNDPALFAAFGLVTGPRPGDVDEWGNIP